jgi:hypothetical protein
MITRAYQNSKGERQEVTLSPEVWESITDVDLANILGFNEEPEVELPEAVEAPEAAEATEEVEAPVKQKAPVKKRQAK